MSGIVNSGFFNIPYGFQDYYLGAGDALVMKMNETREINFFSYLGGQGMDIPCAIELINDEIYITGMTESTDFLITINSFQNLYKGNMYGFIFKLNYSKFFVAINETIQPGTNTIITPSQSTQSTETSLQDTDSIKTSTKTSKNRTKSMGIELSHLFLLLFSIIGIIILRNNRR
ncbi:MAG: hypothetical protein ACXAC7_16730 [Candidatus Hodarchaeales archaeon]|jgi:hypothetical protein